MDLPATIHGLQLKPYTCDQEEQLVHLFATIMEPEDGDRVAVEVVDDTEVLCFFIHPGKVRSIVSGLARLDLIATLDDLSLDLLLGRDPGAPYNAALEHYLHLVDAYRWQHLKLDNVLDKISAYGITSLDAMDLAVLKGSFGSERSVPIDGKRTSRPTSSLPS